MKKLSFAETLLAWFDLHGRKDLPWQQDKTLYRVWVSEIMLQQTQVTTVIPYYERFMQYFPDIDSLANADEDTVLHYWSGLGYYRRARFLHAAAKKIMTDFAGKFPNTLNDLMTLPGIGRTTAGAMLSIACQTKASILDGNVKRVLTRLHGIEEWVDDKKLWPLAEELTPQKRVGDYTQAIMDLGATLCTRGKPRCEACPFEQTCIAHGKGIEKLLPIKKPKKAIPTRQTTFLILKKNNSVLLEKRPPMGVWANLWVLPQIEGHASPKAIKAHCKELYGFTPNKITVHETFKHTFSHFHLMIAPISLNFLQNQNKIMADQQQIWYNLHESPMIGIPKPVKLLLEKML
jgi:A/G-specific adenine glycosylase